MKFVYYHPKIRKGERRATYITKYEDGDTLAQIKRDMRANQCVLDAIFYRSLGKVTFYTDYLTKSDVYGNPIE